MFVEYQIKGCKKGIWGARITQSDPHSANRVSPINKRMGGGTAEPESGKGQMVLVRSDIEGDGDKVGQIQC